MSPVWHKKKKGQEGHDYEKKNTQTESMGRVVCRTPKEDKEKRSY